MIETIVHWAIYLVALIVVIFRRDVLLEHTMPVAALWVTAPIAACLIWRKSVLAFFSLSALRIIRTVLMCVAVLISLGMYANHDTLRNRLGAQYVEGYRHWAAEPMIDDFGQTSYPGDHWDANTREGRCGLCLFAIAMLAAEIGIPWLTLHVTSAEIKKREWEEYRAAK